MQVDGVIHNLLSEMETAMEENMASILKRFGDEQSTLLDRYERLSFEVQLNRAMLGRSLSEPAVARYQAPLPPPPQLVAKPVRQERRSRCSALQKVVKKLIRPFIGRNGGKKDGASVAKDPMFWKTFSRSVRV